MLLKNNSLAFRLKLSTFVWVCVAIISIMWTIILSWRFAGGAAAINAAGSLRMQVYRMGTLLHENTPPKIFLKHIQDYEATLKLLKNGDTERPLSLPDDKIIYQKINTLEHDWQYNMKPRFLYALEHKTQVKETYLRDFVKTIDSLVLSIEHADDHYTVWLRVFQTSLMVMVIIGAFIMVTLLNLWVIHPLNELQKGVKLIHDGRFGTQIPIDSSSEFAHVDQGFNQMSRRLLDLYSHLEQEVADKTQDLEHKNYTLSNLYEFSKFLNQSQSASEVSNVFLERVMSLIPHITASSIRIIDFNRKKVDLLAQINLPQAIQESLLCQHFDGCLCGRSYQEQEWSPVSFQYIKETQNFEPQCRQYGFESIRSFPICYNKIDMGILTLFFPSDKQLSHTNVELLESLCNQLGAMLTNARLIEESKQLAVLQERNLIAQGLHDSIAQTLNFLNLQTQVLEDVLKEKNLQQANETLQMIKQGVKESYEDVRELLLNFRIKITKKEFTEAVATLTQRFEQQTNIKISVSWRGNNPSLSNEQQLQFLFILQESLSNVRKHSNASHVHITFTNEDSYIMNIRDDGCGFDAKKLPDMLSSHVGLGIMQERANRIKAQLYIKSEISQFTEITLVLSSTERTLS